jgi:integrating conjugative element protein (TIGR03749 family)
MKECKTMTANRWVAIWCLALGFVAPLSEARTAVWDKTVIELQMVVGVEQIVIFPADGAVGLPAALGNQAVFRTLFTGQTAYWTALQAFENQRIKVRMDSGEYILLDVSARIEKSPPAKVERLQVVMAADAMTDSMGEGAVSVSGASLQATMFEVIRYAAQNIYSPGRLVDEVSGIRAIPLGLKGNQNRLYNQGAHKGLVILPYKAWSVGALYVTAFVVSNEHSHPLQLDNRKVMHVAQTHRNGVGPHFLASSFFRHQVQKRGEPGDRTTLFVVTDRPIQSVIRG